MQHVDENAGKRHGDQEETTSSSESDEGMDTDTGADEAMTSAITNNSRVSGRASAQPVIDDEGFQLVTSKKGGKRG